MFFFSFGYLSRKVDLLWQCVSQCGWRKVNENSLETTASEMTPIIHSTSVHRCSVVAVDTAGTVHYWQDKYDGKCQRSRLAYKHMVTFCQTKSSTFLASSLVSKIEWSIYFKRCRFSSPRPVVLGTVHFTFPFDKNKNDKKKKSSIFLCQRCCGKSYRIMTYLQEKYSHCVEVKWCNCSHPDKTRGSTQDCRRRCS